MSAAADLVRHSAADLAAKIAAGEVSSVEVTRACLDQIEATDGEYHAFLHVAGEQALATAAEIDKTVAAGEALPSALAGVPLALKDVFTTTDMPTTAGSRILENWTSPYDATVTARLRQAGIPILGYNFMPLSVWRTSVATPGRGGAARGRPIRTGGSPVSMAPQATTVASVGP